jgi:hypothetical protein
LYNSISDHDTLSAALQQSIAAGDKSGGVVYSNWNKKYSVRAGAQLTNNPETDPLDVAWLKTCAPRIAPAQAPAPLPPPAPTTALPPPARTTALPPPAQATALPSLRDAEMKKIQDQVKTGGLDSLTVEQLRFIVKDYERVPISELGGLDKQEYDDFKKRLAEKESTTDAASQQKMIMVGAGAIVVLLLLRSRRR